MRILITKHFGKWSKQNGLSHDNLIKSAIEILNGSIDANLGSRLFKKRIRVQGKGKRSAGRVIVFYQINNKLIYIHGFMKKDKDDLTDKEFNALKAMAGIFLNMTEEEYNHSLKNGDFEEITI